jgi:3-methylfumaryl-CoA hydratase
MTKINMAELTPWLGRSVQHSDVIRIEQTHLMAATLGLSNVSLTPGSALPPLWHWLYFLEGLPPDQLGPDSHPARGGFLPPVSLENRMWAGGHLTFHEDLPIGALVEKNSTIASIEHKQGRSGELVFVAVKHDIYHQGRLAISEVHDIVYKQKVDLTNTKNKTAQQASPSASAPSSLYSEAFTPNSTTLFRYSALTFNGHRIHYDVDYCRLVEGYDNLVIHGPLSATLLANFAQHVTGKRLAHFSYRGVQPAILGQTLTLHADNESNIDSSIGIKPEMQTKTNSPGLRLWTTLENGGVSMQAQASFK